MPWNMNDVILTAMTSPRSGGAHNAAAPKISISGSPISSKRDGGSSRQINTLARSSARSRTAANLSSFRGQSGRLSKVTEVREGRVGSELSLAVLGLSGVAAGFFAGLFV